ncbi:hypothetical protein K523DRAFT_79363 [Schizophyllum commune Tattone D]|nr:hypothetical protein K523DRAFT_79363 [Schizophyllum commune Tattone D]
MVAGRKKGGKEGRKGGKKEGRKAEQKEERRERRKRSMRRGRIVLVLNVHRSKGSYIRVTKHAWAFCAEPSESGRTRGRVQRTYERLPRRDSEYRWDEQTEVPMG